MDAPRGVWSERKSMTAFSTVDPFEPHPESTSTEKKPNNILTLEQIREVITSKMIEVRTEIEPKWGWNRHTIAALLTNIMIEMEEKCQHN